MCAALELLPALAGAERRAVRVWAAAGVAGAALGPAIGGLLTQLISWQSIFVAQVPLALIPALVVFGRGAPVVRRARAGRAAHRRQPRARPALGRSRRGPVPARAAARRGLAHVADRGRLRRHGDARRGARGRAVRAARRRARARARRRARCSGAGGVAALGLLPHAGWAVDARAAAARRRRARALAGSPHRGRAGRALARRHPRRLDDRLAPRGRRARARPARRPSSWATSTRSASAPRRRAPSSCWTRASPRSRRSTSRRQIANDIKREPGAAARHQPLVRLGGRRTTTIAPRCRSSRAQLNDQLDRAATSSFERSFLFAALLAGLALIPIALTRRVSL